jgi:anti-sigma-K factor RskA
MSTDPMRTDIHALSGAYAVDALDEDERAEFERHLATCPSCQAEVDDLREAAGTLAEVTAVAPPAEVRERLMAEIRTVRPLPPVVERTPARPTPVRRRWAAPLAAAAAVAVLTGTGALVWHPWTSSTTQVSAVVAQVEHAPDARRFTTHGPGGATVTVYRSVSLDKAVVVARDLGHAPDGKVYQLWLQDSSGAMRPAGFLAAGTSSSATLSGAAASAKGAGITVEPAGGSPEPTSDPVALVAFTA